MKRLMWLMPMYLLFVTGITFGQTDTTSPSPEQLASENGNFLSIEDVQVYYETQGDADNPAVILLHGFGGSTFTWRYTMTALLDAGYYVIAIDLPPFGLSDKSPHLNYSRSQMATWVVGLMDELDLAEATLVGHSMGGAVAGQFAVRYPERLDRLVLVSAAIFSDDSRVSATPEIFTDLLDRINPDSAFATAALNLIFNAERFETILKDAYHDPTQVTDEVVAGYTKSLQLDTWSAGFLTFLKSENPDPVTLDDLANVVDVPVLIIWGEEDTWVPPEIANQLHTALEQSQLTLYSDVGHLPMEEAPDVFNEDLITFLDQTN